MIHWGILLTNKLNNIFKDDEVFWVNRIKNTGLGKLLKFSNYYDSLSHFYFNIRNDSCYMVQVDKRQYRYHFSSTLEGIIRYCFDIRNHGSDVKIIFERSRNIPAETILIIPQLKEIKCSQMN